MLCEPLFHYAPNAKNNWKISYLCHRHPFLRVYFCINLSSNLDSALVRRVTATPLARDVAEGRPVLEGAAASGIRPDFEIAPLSRLGTGTNQASRPKSV
jgi:hypothetical protein